MINNNDEDVINKNLSEQTKAVKCHIVDNDNTINIITNEVSGLDLNHQLAKADALERSRRSRKFSTNANSLSPDEPETQGDQLNRIKAQRRNARSATTVTTPITITIEDERSHRRSASQPKDHDYISPLKGLKPQFKSTTVSVYNTRSALRRAQTIDVKKEEASPQTSEITISSTKLVRRANKNAANIKT